MSKLLRALPLAVVLAGGAALPARAQQDGATLVYTVQPQDTLIGLGKTLLVDPAAWPEVARLNRLPDPNRIRPGQALKVPARLLRSAELPAQLVSVEGDVRIDGQPAAQGAPLRPGQRLSTEAASSAVLQLGDGSRVKLMPLSDTTLGEHRRYEIKAAGSTPGGDDGVFASTMRLVRGSLDLLASKVLRAKPLEVTTPTAVIGVRGTQYRVHHAVTPQEATRTEVLEGLVRADATAGAAARAGVDLPAGQGAVLQPGGGAPKAVALLPAPSLAGVPARFERPLVRFQVPGEPAALRVQVAADPAFDRVVRDEQVAAGSEVRLAGLADGVWQLRARRVDGNGLAGADASTSFTLKARPEPPAGITPRARGKATVGEVAVAWAENTEAASYRLEVARDTGFGDVVARQDSLGGGQTRVTLTEPGTYHWRLASVRADGDRGPWGDAQSFELRALPEPPSGGLTDDGRGLQLAWSGRPEDRQQVELARDPGFAQVVNRADLTETRWTLATPNQAGSYYFRYRSVEPDGFTTPWSSTLKLEVPRDWTFLWFFAPLLLAL